MMSYEENEALNDFREWVKGIALACNVDPEVLEDAALGTSCDLTPKESLLSNIDQARRIVNDWLDGAENIASYKENWEIW